MATKKVSFGTTPAPKAAAQPPTAEKWVENRNAEPTMKRLTVDVPADLHSRIKVACARRGVKMADEIRELLETHFPE